jgi:preprotein translocase subunit Sec63
MLYFRGDKIDNMKRIERHRAILGVDDKATLSDLKKVYRKIMMEWHPDKFQDSEESKKMAEEKSTKLIASYHFLVSVHPETHAATLTAYTATISESSINDFEFKSEILRVVFSDGNEYEYYGVPKAIYVKLVNSDTPDRFARRHIYENYLYRSTSKIVGGE